jgi:hypothetical protein
VREWALCVWYFLSNQPLVQAVGDRTVGEFDNPSAPASENRNRIHSCNVYPMLDIVGCCTV